jgi:hypothetical protein
MTCVLLLDMFFTAADLARLRRCLTDTARLAGLAEPRLWYADEALRCRVTDDGPGLTDAAIPAALPAPDFGEDGRGLWLARELSDRLDITGGAGGAIVTLEFDLAVTRRDRPGLAPAAAPGGQARR